jgi:hypothetical protein
MPLTLNLPTTAPVMLSFMGVLGKRLFEPIDFIGEFPIDAHETEQRRKQAGGAFCLVTLFWASKIK